MDGVEARAVLTGMGSAESVRGMGVAVHCSAEEGDVERDGSESPNGLADVLVKGLRVGRTGRVACSVLDVSKSLPRMLKMSRLDAVGTAVVTGSAKKRQGRRNISKGREREREEIRK